MQQEVAMGGKAPVLARLGVLIPASDVVVEHDLKRFLPDEVSFHTARLKQGRSALLGDLENLYTMIASAEDAAKSVAVADIDLLLFCCTSASFFNGPGWDRTLADRLKDATGVSSITTTTAIIEALNSQGHKRVFLATPYPDFCNKTEIDVLTSAGFEVAGSLSFGCTRSVEVGAVSTDKMIAMISAARDEIVASEALLVSCTGVRSTEIITELERITDRPVVTSNSAIIWAALGTLGLPLPKHGLGALFSKPTCRSGVPMDPNCTLEHK